MRYRVSAIASLFSAAIVLFNTTAPVLAATATTAPTGGASSNGLQISPVVTNLTIPAGTSQIIDVYVTNITGKVAQFQGVIDDFTAGNNENGVPAILLNGQSAPSHGLRKYVSPIGSFSMPGSGLGQIRDIKVKVSIPAGTAGGGYYGAVRFLPASVNPTSKNVSLSESVVSLILVTVPGKISEQMSISSFDVRQHVNLGAGVQSIPSKFLTSDKAISAVVGFSNTGNDQEQPFGNIVVKKGSKQVGLLPVNNIDPRGDVLPGSVRLFSIPLTNLSPLGKYTLEGNFGYGTTGQLLSASYTFYIVPVSLMVTAGVVLILLLVVIFVLPRMLRSYRQRILRGSRRSRW